MEEISTAQVSVCAGTAVELLMGYAPKLILAIVVLTSGYGWSIESFG